MDIIIYCVAAVFVGILLWFVTKKNIKKQEVPDQRPQAAVPQGAKIGPGGIRRRQTSSRIRRNIERQQQLQQEQIEEEKEDENEDDSSNPDSDTESKLPTKKIGTKKQKKLELKEQKRQLREATEREREKQKLEDEKQEQIRLKQEEEDKVKEEKKAAELKKLKEEQEKREEEEYLKLAASFEIEEEGHEQGVDDEEDDHALEDFINYIVESKVIFLEDLASHFGLRTQDAIERVQTLLQEGRLTGVIDDRGKFIYITMDELKAVAAYIQERGRVSISELARASNSLINIKVEKDLKLSS